MKPRSCLASGESDSCKTLSLSLGFNGPDGP